MVVRGVRERERTVFVSSARVSLEELHVTVLGDICLFARYNKADRT